MYLERHRAGTRLPIFFQCSLFVHKAEPYKRAPGPQTQRNKTETSAMRSSKDLYFPCIQQLEHAPKHKDDVPMIQHSSLGVDFNPTPLVNPTSFLE